MTVRQGYRDLYFRIIVALIAAHLIVSFGATESIWQLFISWDYYRSLTFSFLIAFFLVSEVYFVTTKLDQRFDWKQHTAQRIGLQVLLGLMVPALTAFLLAAIYFGIFGIRILDTMYLRFDFPVVVIMLVLLNVYYLAFYFYRQWQLIASQIAVPGTVEKQKTKEVFVVQKGAKNIPLPVETISYVYHNGEHNFVRTFQREDFLITQPLDDVEQQLKGKQFFRVNRQMLVNFAACQHFEPLDFGKLKLIVQPEIKEEIIISQKRAKPFKEWIAR